MPSRPAVGAHVRPPGLELVRAVILIAAAAFGILVALPLLIDLATAIPV